jgi:hypothetical protein
MRFRNGWVSAIIFVIAVGVFVFSYKGLVLNKNTSNDDVFFLTSSQLSSYSTGSEVLFLYKPSINKIIAQRTLVTADPYLGGNVYDANNGNIIFWTNGYCTDEYCTGCANKDGTCATRIYKTDFASSTTVKLGELPSSDEINQFQFGPITGNFYFTTIYGDSQSGELLGLFDINTGAIQNILNFSQVDNEVEIISTTPDEKALIIHISTSTDTLGNWINSNELARIDLATKKMEPISIPAGGSFMDMSPDGNYISFYYPPTNPIGTSFITNLHIYNTKTGSVQDLPDSFFSNGGDSGRFTPDYRNFYFVQSSTLYSYDLTSQQKTAIGPADIIWEISNSGRYVLYTDVDSASSSLHIYDSVNKAQIAALPSIFNTIMNDQPSE